MYLFNYLVLFVYAWRRYIKLHPDLRSYWSWVSTRRCFCSNFGASHRKLRERESIDLYILIFRGELQLRRGRWTCWCCTQRRKMLRLGQHLISHRIDIQCQWQTGLLHFIALYIYICIYIYVCVHTYADVIHTYTTHVICAHTYIHTYRQTDRHTDMQTCGHPYIHTSIHPSIHASIHPYIHTNKCGLENNEKIWHQDFMPLYLE